MDSPNNECPVNELPELTEAQLREQYENAEIERFLHIFSTYVTEIKSSDVPELPRNPLSTAQPGDPTTNLSESVANASYDTTQQSFSASIAKHYVAPYLPAQQCEIPPFTFARFRLTLNRLYIIAQVQWPHLKSVVELALWTDYTKSLTGCLVYWFLWWLNLLLPAVLFSILVSLLKRGFFPYPSLADLKEHNQRISQADEFSDRISDRISPSSTLDIKELWRLYRLANAGWKKKFKTHKPSTSVSSVGSNASARASRASLNIDSDGTESLLDVPDDPTIIDDAETTKEALELRRYALFLLTEVADFYERTRNIAIWRNPIVTRRYTAALFGLLLLTTFIPTRYLAKGAWFSLGFLYWHVVPVLSSLSPSDKKRLPPLLGDAPTDAEYAMKLISERVAKGQDVQALFGKKNGGKKKGDPGTSGASPSSPKAPERPWSPPRGQSKLKGIGKMIGNEGYKMAKEAMKSPSLASHPLFAGAMAIVAPDADSNLHSFPGQRGSHPGVITLTGKRLNFTSFVSPQSKVDIDVGSITGVRKNGLLKGLQVSYLDPETNASTEEKFLWISGRDELFARLVGFGKKKWQNV